ncbi:hypothetical protein [Rhodococcus sovatensis]|uniref:Uncharacterized protein n=1 Tax=Rhodococcus sovatensis TaxID=1805840 RepID=A0ABZ2PRC7_9NOCA
MLGKPEDQSPTTVHTVFGTGMFALAFLLVSNSSLGPLGIEVFDYPISITLQNQLIGLEIVTLILVTPLSIAAGVLALRGHRAAGPMAFGPAAYTAYMFVQYVLGPEYATFNAVVLFDLGVFALSAVLAVWAWTITDAAPMPDTTPTRQRINGLAWMHRVSDGRPHAVNTKCPAVVRELFLSREHFNHDEGHLADATIPHPTRRCRILRRPQLGIRGRIGAGDGVGAAIRPAHARR